MYKYKYKSCHGPDIFLYIYRVHRPLQQLQLSTLSSYIFIVFVNSYHSLKPSTLHPPFLIAIASIRDALDNFDSSISPVPVKCPKLLSEKFSPHKKAPRSYMPGLQCTPPRFNKGITDRPETPPPGPLMESPSATPYSISLQPLCCSKPCPLSNPLGLTRRPQRPRCSDPLAQDKAQVLVSSSDSP